MLYVTVIGTDCYSISTGNLQEAYDDLKRTIEFLQTHVTGKLKFFFQSL